MQVIGETPGTGTQHQHAQAGQGFSARGIEQIERSGILRIAPGPIPMDVDVIAGEALGDRHAGTQRAQRIPIGGPGMEVERLEEPGQSQAVVIEGIGDPDQSLAGGRQQIMGRQRRANSRSVRAQLGQEEREARAPVPGRPLWVAKQPGNAADDRKARAALLTDVPCAIRPQAAPLASRTSQNVNKHTTWLQCW